MTRQEFDKLVEKYGSGECTQEEAEMVEKWAQLHFNRHSEYSVFDGAKERAETEERIWRQVKSLATPGRGLRRVSHTRFFWPGLAACLALLIVAGIWWRKGVADNPHFDVGSKGLETRNTTLSQQRVVLADCSVVVLEAGAAIVVDERYGQQSRTVHLTGEAFFEVTPDPQQPFLVYAGELVTEVLGTSFRIKPGRDDEKIEVSVTTGKVSIYTGAPREGRKRTGVIAVPNQRVIYDTKTRTIVQDLVDIPEMVVPPSRKSLFQFDEAPLEEVLGVMRTVYGVEIVVSSPLLNRCVFIGDLNGLELYEQLDYLCEVVDARYEVRGTTIFVNGKGC